MSKYPKFENKVCNGYKLSKSSIQVPFSIQHLVQFYNSYDNKESFFNVSFFDKLAGTDQLRKQLIEGKSSTEIRKSWQSKLANYKVLRKKYLLY